MKRLLWLLVLVPTFALADTTGPNNCATGATGGTWTSPTNACDSNGTTNASATSSTAGDLNTTNYSFSTNPPNGATVTAITVYVTCTGADQAQAARREITVQLIKGGSATGDSVAATCARNSETELTVNGSTNALWNVSWTPSDIRASNFGAAVRVSNTNGYTRLIDQVKITVTYTVGRSRRMIVI